VKFVSVAQCSFGNTVHMPDAIDPVLIDLSGEVAAVEFLLSSLSHDDWSKETPAPGWNVADQVIHLGLFDRRAQWSMTDVDRFTSDFDAMRSGGGVDGIHNAERHRSPEDLLSWWREGAADLASAAHSLDLSARCVWYGPSMSARSMLTARLMETWAHGYDIADAVGAVMPATDRLRHVAHIGVGARRFAFAANKREMPEGDVFVELVAPSGAMWTWGEVSATNSVKGDALNFCLAVTQRRHPEDCDLDVQGSLATEWMSIAQAFAGAPGVGRTKGQFD
jgi:uncharacterized protein (TIGR03084 family)